MFDYRCEVCSRKISEEEFESFEGMCEDCYTEYLQQIEDEEEYYPEGI
jgi:NMD protein affecting ribosome stability and mRNA decay